MRKLTNKIKLGTLSIMLIIAASITSCSGVGLHSNIRYIDSQSNISHMLNGTIAFVRPAERTSGGGDSENYGNPPNTIGQAHEAYCAGFFISQSEIMTAAHCVSRRHVTTLITPFGILRSSVPDLTSPVGDLKKIVTYSMYSQDVHMTSYKFFAVTAFDRDRDVAILALAPGQSLRGIDHTILHIANTNPTVGERTYAVGHPLGLIWTLTEGLVSRDRVGLDVHEDETDESGNPLSERIVEFVQSATDVFFGNSGGPLFNNQGDVIGVCSMMFGQQSHLAFFVHPDEIRTFIHEVRDAQAEHRATMNHDSAAQIIGNLGKALD